MKKILLALLICAGVASCKDDDPGTEPPKPTVSLTEGTSTTTSITFTVTPDEAEKCAYLYAKVEENVQVEQPSAETVLKDGVQVSAEQATPVTLSPLDPESAYIVFAAASNGSVLSEVTTLRMETGLLPEPDYETWVQATSGMGQYYTVAWTAEPTGNYMVQFSDIEFDEYGEAQSAGELLVSSLTVSDFSDLWDKSNMLPLIIFAIIFGFCVSACGGDESPMGKLLNNLNDIIMKFVGVIMLIAPLGLGAYFANLVATYGSQIATDYARALVVYYPLCFIYIFVAFPLFAWFGGGKGAVKEMFRHIAKPAITSLGTCSSVATIPTNMEEAEATGISKDVSDMVLPLGATMHMDGSCFSCVLKIAFVLGVFGQGMGFERLIPIVLVAVLSSVGMSGVPGGGYIGEYIICSIFFPTQMEVAFPILVAIGNLVDPPATMINSAGDYVVSFIVSRFVDGKDWFQKQLAAKEDR